MSKYSNNTVSTTCQDFAEERVDLRSPENIDKLKQLMDEIPHLWNSLKTILGLEKRLKYLPKEVSNVVLRLIQMRTDMFRNSTQRKNEDYRDYDWDQEGEVATQYYPNWRIIRWPRTYSVPKSRTSCNKKYQRSKGFSVGLFTVGCGCPRNITLGKSTFLYIVKPESKSPILCPNRPHILALIPGQV